MAGKTRGEGGGSGGGSWITGGTGGGSHPSLRRSAGPTLPGTASCTDCASALYCSREIRPRTLSILSSALSGVRISAATPVRGSGEVGEGRTGRFFRFFSSVLAVFVRVEVLQSFFSRFFHCLAAAANVTPLFLFTPLVFPRQSWQSQSSLAGRWPHGTDVAGTRRLGSILSSRF